MSGGDFAYCRGKIANFAGCPPLPPPGLRKAGVQDLRKNLQMGFSAASVLLSKSIGTAAGLGWAGPGWAALGWAGLGWAGLGGAGLGADREDRVRMYENTYVLKKRIRACMHAPTGLGGNRRCKGERQEFGRPSRNQYIYIYIYIR